MSIFLRPPGPSSVTASAQRVSGNSRAQSAPYNTKRSITASAERIKIDGLHTAPTRPYAEWQREAWTGYERVGEIKYGFDLVGDLLSRLRLYPAANISSDQVPMEIGDAIQEGKVNRELADAATEAMNQLQENDLPGMISTFGVNFNVSGECYLCYLPTGPVDKNTGQAEKRWSIRSSDEVEIRTGEVVINPMRGSTVDQRVFSKKLDPYVARLWHPSARYSKEPTSSMVGIQDPIEELLMIQRLVRSITRSRLNAGVMFIPDGLTVAAASITPEPSTDEDGQEVSTADMGGTFLDNLMDAMTDPISDEGSASAVVPMVVTGPQDLGMKIQHIKIERSADEWLVNRSDRALERILQGINVPKEVVSGLQNVKYANAIIITDNFFRANIEPLALALADALTSAFLRPLLRGRGFEEADLNRVVIWYDPSEIVTRPNQAEDATAGFDRYLLSPSAWRGEHGFSDADAPTEKDLAFMLLAAKAILPPDITTALLQTLLPETLGAKREENIQNSATPFPDTAKKILTAVPAPDTAVGGQA